MSGGAADDTRIRHGGIRIHYGGIRTLRSERRSRRSDLRFHPICRAAGRGIRTLRRSRSQIRSRAVRAPAADLRIHPIRRAGRGRQTVLDEAGGIHVSAETARRMACDAATVTMRHGPGGEILDVGRRTRTISPALRRALAARDRQCRFPGCGNVRCDAHHLEHWADGGRTALDTVDAGVGSLNPSYAAGFWRSLPTGDSAFQRGEPPVDIGNAPADRPGAASRSTSAMR